VLNSLTRFAAAAFAPALLNIALIARCCSCRRRRHDRAGPLAIAVLAGGVAAARLVLDRGAPRRRQAAASAPAHDAAVQGAADPDPAGDARRRRLLDQPALLRLFRDQLCPKGALVYLGFADRLNQLPLSIIGTALGTAILPTISRAIDRGNETSGAADVQARRPSCRCC
jgi:putative peptidoglycan lipid II flippase